jgi:hypothetical protein
MHRNVRQWIVSASYTHHWDAILHELTNRGGGGSCPCNLHEVENMFLATLRPVGLAPITTFADVGVFRHMPESLLQAVADFALMFPPHKC